MCKYAEITLAVDGFTYRARILHTDLVKVGLDAAHSALAVHVEAVRAEIDALRHQYWEAYAALKKSPEARDTLTKVYRRSRDRLTDRLYRPKASLIWAPAEGRYLVQF